MNGNLYSIIKYNKEGEEEWTIPYIYTNSAGDAQGILYVFDIAESKKGGYVVGGYINGTIEIGDKEITTGNYRYWK